MHPSPENLFRGSSRTSLHWSENTASRRLWACGGQSEHSPSPAPESVGICVYRRGGSIAWHFVETTVESCWITSSPNCCCRLKNSALMVELRSVLFNMKTR